MYFNQIGFLYIYTIVVNYKVSLSDIPYYIICNLCKSNEMGLQNYYYYFVILKYIYIIFNSVYMISLISYGFLLYGCYIVYSYAPLDNAIDVIDFQSRCVMGRVPSFLVRRCT